MSDFPDFSSHGYQVLQTLGQNYIGGRSTYLAADPLRDRRVVIKQFQFAQFGSDWNGFKACEREIEILRQLNHPGIPRYLDSFETPDGFCMVQEYKNAQSLAVPRSFEPADIKKIALSVLEILADLQSRIPCVIHRDIKPENILIDEELNVYLVDFGFARIGAGEVAMSSVALGTLGFMPPEQLYNRQLTESTDLYSLGMTLICLLTQTKSTAIDTLIDEDNRVNFQPLVPQLSLRWIDWLEKLVQPNPKNRYPNAAAALSALKPIYILRQPEVKFSASSLEFIATSAGEKLLQTIAVTNSAPGTVLEGSWEVAPHDSDPPHTPDSHAWISFKPAKFSGNAVECKIAVDTSKLMADRFFRRQIFLRTNSSPETLPLALNVQTAPLIKTRKLPYFSLAFVGGLSILFSLLVAAGFTVDSEEKDFLFLFAGLGLVAGGIIGAGSRNGETTKWLQIWNGAWRGFLIGGGSLLGITEIPLLLGWGSGVFEAQCLGALVGAIVPFFTVNNIGDTASKMARQGFSRITIISALVLTISLGLISGLGFWMKIPLSWMPPALVVTAVPLAGILLYPPLRRWQLIAKYSKTEQHLIKP